MATEKQIEWLSKLAKWKGKKVDVESVRKLNNGQLDELFENLKNIKVIKKQPVEKEQPIKKMQINYARFGLACKIVLNNVNFDFVFNDSDRYIKRVLQYYEFMQQAEEALESTYIVGEVDADLLRDEQRDGNLIMAGLM